MVLSAANVEDYLRDAYKSSLKWRLPSGASHENCTSVTPLARAGVIGGGTMGRGIALALCRAGLDVTLIEETETTKAACRREIEKTIAREKARKRISAAEEKSIAQKLTLATDLNQLADVDLVVEAVFENMTLKRELFGRLDKICKPSTILGTNTSSLDIDKIALATSRPEKVVGIHFFNPAHLQKTVEVVHGQYTSGQAVATAFEASKRMQKLAVLVKNCPAFLFNRLLSVYLQQTMRLMSVYGYLPQKIDSVFLSFGFSMGPVTLSDLNGMDVWERISSEHGWIAKNPLQVKMVELKRYGRKTGNGFYHYLSTTGKKVADKVTEELILKVSSSEDRSRMPRLLSDRDMIEFVLFPMVNEGLRCLDEKIIETAPQIDLMFIYGMDWPKQTGGPMRWAESVGFKNIFNYIDNQYRMSNDDYWKPAASLHRLAGDRSRL